MARYTKTVVVAGTANSETLSLGVTSTEGEPKRVLGLWVYESTATRNNDAQVRAYVERERVVDMPIRSFIDQGTSQLYPRGAGRIDLDLDLPIGQSLYVGQQSGGTASNLTFTIEYVVVE